MRNQITRYLGSFTLMMALVAPLAIQAQDRDDRHDRDDQKNQRVYDRRNKDYHQWNADEDRRYRQWYDQRYQGQQYRDYNRLNRKDKDDYWKWRHQHGDHDRDNRRGDRDEKH